MALKEAHNSLSNWENLVVMGWKDDIVGGCTGGGGGGAIDGDGVGVGSRRKRLRNEDRLKKEENLVETDDELDIVCDGG